MGGVKIFWVSDDLVTLLEDHFLKWVNGGTSLDMNLAC